MHRREYLASGIATSSLLTGCLTLPDGGTTPTPRPSVEIREREAEPDIPIRPAVEVAAATGDDAGPPELRASVKNTADHAIEVGEERAIVFAFVSSDQQPGLTLLPLDGSYPAVESGCWRLAEPIAVAEYYGIVNLDPGETAERQLGVWGSPDGEGCLPTGQFRFETQYVGARDRGEGIEDQDWSGSWGFTLAVE